MLPLLWGAPPSPYFSFYPSLSSNIPPPLLLLLYINESNFPSLLHFLLSLYIFFPFPFFPLIRPDSCSLLSQLSPLPSIHGHFPLFICARHDTSCALASFSQTPCRPTHTAGTPPIASCCPPPATPFCLYLGARRSNPRNLSAV